MIARQRSPKSGRIFNLPRNVFLLGLTSLFNDFSSDMVLSIFPAFFVSVLKAGAASLGLVDGIAEAASNFFKIYSGILSDRFQSRKPLVAGGYALSVATRPIYVAAGSVGAVLGLRFVDRIGKGLRDSPRDALISLASPRAEVGRSFGYHRTMDTLGAILGPLCAFLLLRFFPARFDIIFVVAFFVGLAAIATILLVQDAEGKAEKSRPFGFASSFAALSAEFKRYLAAVFVLSIGTLPVAVLLLKTTVEGLSTVPLFYAIYNMSYAAFAITAGKASDRTGPGVVLLLGYMLLIAGYAVLTMADGIASLVAAFVLLGLFPALTDGVWRALASRITEEKVRGGGIGWISAANGLGALVAGTGGGFIWQNVSPAAALAVAAFVVVCGLLLLANLLRVRGA